MNVDKKSQDKTTISKRTSTSLLAFGFFIIIILMAAFGIGAVNLTNDLAKLTTKMYRHPFTVSNAALNIKSQTDEIRQHMMGVAATQNTVHLENLFSEFDELESNVHKNFDIILERFLGDKSTIEQARDTFVQWKAIRNQIIQLNITDPNQAKFEIFYGKGSKHYVLLETQLDEMIAFARNKASVFHINSEEEHQQGLWLLYILLGVVIISAFMIAAYVISKIQRSEKERNDTLKQLGDFRFAMDAHAYISATDVEGNITYVNDAFCEISGFNRDELIGQNHNIMKSDEHTPEFYADLWQTLVEGQVWHGEIKDKNKNGAMYWVNATIVPFLDEHGVPFQYIAMRTDITNRKEVEAHLRDREEEVRAIVGTVVDGIITIDTKGIIQTFNPAAAQLFGYTESEAIHQNIKLLMPEPHSSGHDGYLQHYLKTGKAKIIGIGRELVGRRKNGTMFPMSLSVSEMEVQGQRMFTGVVRDITDRKRAEEEINMAKQLAENANMAKSDFLANMSHEIRTPMNAIIGMTDLCLKTRLNAKQNDYLKKVHFSALSLLGIINDILDFSKIEAGKLDIEVISFNLDTVLDNLAAVIPVDIQKSNVELLFFRAPDIPGNLIGDPLRLGQILTNLTNNAIKFTESGEICVTVKKLTESAGKVVLEFTVQDTGIGMSPDQIKRLFKSFSQADSSTSRKYGGTGLGLAISKQLVELMDGEIKVKSAPGVGSLFTFTVVLKRDMNQTKKIVYPITDLHGLRVLVVDDNATSLDIFKSYLDSFSFHVTLASSGEAAIAELKQAAAPYDIIFMDWKMPNLDGMETIKKMKAEIDFVAYPKIILVTAYDWEEGLAFSAQEHLDGFLVKPVNPSILINSILEALGKEKVYINYEADAQKAEVALIAPIQGAKILLVEDNEINQQVARELLEQARFYIDVANNGVEALEKLEENEYDCVLMDIQMPIMDGIETTRKIREDGRFKNLPILAMTANVMQKDQLDAKEAGMNGHIGKPINPQDLFGKLVKWIEPGERELPDLLNEDHLGDVAGDTFPSLPGIDTVGGLARIGGSPRSYEKLLKMFANKQAQCATDIRDSIRRGDLKQASLLAHTLKGSSGNVGATALYQAAYALDSALKEDASVAPDTLIDAVEQELAQVIAAIENISKNDHIKTKVKDQIPTKDPVPQLQKLLGMVEQNDSEAKDAIDEIIDQITEPTLVQALQDLAKQIDKYDFDAATLSLKAVMTKFNTLNEGE